MQTEQRSTAAKNLHLLSDLSFITGLISVYSTHVDIEEMFLLL